MGDRVSDLIPANEAPLAMQPTNVVTAQAARQQNQQNQQGAQDNMADNVCEKCEFCQNPIVSAIEWPNHNGPHTGLNQNKNKWLSAWMIKWRLPKAADVDGYIVQEINRESKIDGIEKNAHYYEAWKVRKGQVETDDFQQKLYTRTDPDDKSVHVFDDVYMEPHENTQDGHVEIRGLAKFCPGELLGFERNSVELAGGVLASKNPPSWWTNPKTPRGTQHNLTIRWNGSTRERGVLKNNVIMNEIPKLKEK